MWAYRTNCIQLWWRPITMLTATYDTAAELNCQLITVQYLHVVYAVAESLWWRRADTNFTNASIFRSLSFPCARSLLYVTTVIQSTRPIRMPEQSDVVLLQFVFSVRFVAKQYILQQVSEEMSRKLRARNMMVQLSDLYTDVNATINSATDGRMDRLMT